LPRGTTWLAPLPALCGDTISVGRSAQARVQFSRLGRAGQGSERATHRYRRGSSSRCLLAQFLSPRRLFVRLSREGHGHFHELQ
jgi:hypothetical protein